MMAEAKSLVQELDYLFAEYYQSHNRNDYFGTENKGKFRRYCGILNLIDDDKLKKSIETVISVLTRKEKLTGMDNAESRSRFMEIFDGFPCFSNSLNTNNAKNIYLQYCILLVHLYEQRRVPPDHVLAADVLSKYFTWFHFAEALKHQMYPLISTIMQSAIDELESEESFKIEDLRPTALDTVIATMQKHKRLSNKEVEFIKNVLWTANEFKMDRETAANS